MPESRAAAEGLVETGRGRVAVSDTGGAGLPLLMLHAGASSSRAFSALAGGPFGARRRVLCLDLLGHGGSDDARDPAEDYTVAGQADAVVEVLERLDVERVALLGWSLGGLVALEVAASMPGIVGVALVGTPPSARAPGAVFPPADLAGRDPDDAARRRFLAEAGLSGLDGADRDARRADGRAAAVLMADLLARGPDDGREIAAALPVPLLVAFGADDPVVDEAWVAALGRDGLWRGGPQVFPRCGHAPFLDAPDLFAEVLARFTADVAAGAEAEGRDALGGWLGG